MKTGDLSTVERALAIAREGCCESVYDIKRKLKAEGYSAVEAHLSGLSTRKQLIEILRSRTRQTACPENLLRNTRNGVRCDA